MEVKKNPDCKACGKVTGTDPIVDYIWQAYSNLIFTEQPSAENFKFIFEIEGIPKKYWKEYTHKLLALIRGCNLARNTKAQEPKKLR